MRMTDDLQWFLIAEGLILYQAVNRPKASRAYAIITMMAALMVGAGIAYG